MKKLGYEEEGKMKIITLQHNLYQLLLPLSTGQWLCDQFVFCDGNSQEEAVLSILYWVPEENILRRIVISDGEEVEKCIREDTRCCSSHQGMLGGYERGVDSCEPGRGSRWAGLAVLCTANIQRAC